MSLKTWKAEFYPKSAKRVSKKGALDASIQKWEGLREENLKKHQIQLFAGKDIYLREKDTCRQLPHITRDITCALCTHYLQIKGSWGEFADCTMCPLFQSEGKSCCEAQSAYYKTIQRLPSWGVCSLFNPATMIKALRKAQARWEKKKGE